MAGANPGNANLPIGVHKIGIQENGDPRNIPIWHSRGYVPHFESPEVIQHVTFHLADSLPKEVLLRLDAGLKNLLAAKRDVERRKRIETLIDAGHGSCILREPAIASMVQDSLLLFDSRRYRLLAWVVMPNHVHVLFQPMNESAVAKIVASWKKFTARKIRDALRENANREIGVPRKSIPRNGAPVTSSDASVWHREYWDRYIRDKNHLDRTILYIHQNPVKAGLAATPASWQWSSAFPGNANLPIGVGPEKP